MATKWDVKHWKGPLAGTRRGADLAVDGGATHSGKSVAHNQIKERVFELFGKSEHDADRRRQGIPGHLEQLQNIVRNLSRDFGADAPGIEDLVKKDLSKAVQIVDIDIPPLGLVLPASNTVWVFFRHGSSPSYYGQVFEESDLAATYEYWKLTKATIGDFRKEFSVYKAWGYYQGTSTRVAANARDTASDFFRDGLQFESWT